MPKRCFSTFHDPIWRRRNPLSPGGVRPGVGAPVDASSADGANSGSHPVKAAIGPTPLSLSEDAVQVWSAHVRSVHGLAVEGLLP